MPDETLRDRIEEAIDALDWTQSGFGYVPSTPEIADAVLAVLPRRWAVTGGGMRFFHCDDEDDAREFCRDVNTDMRVTTGALRPATVVSWIETEPEENNNE